MDLPSTQWTLRLDVERRGPGVGARPLRFDCKLANFGI